MNKDLSVSRRHFLTLLSGASVALLAGGGLSTRANASTIDPSLRVVDLAERYGPVTRYGITRKGTRIGTHELRFAIDGNRVTVSVESKIRVTVLKVPVFTFRYVAEEVWEDNQLLSVAATTTENKKVTQVSSNHWNPHVIGSERIFNTLTGKESNIDMEDLGQESLTTGRGEVETRHYRMGGDIQAEVWYDQSLRWTRLSFPGKDGNQVDYLIEY